MLKMKRNLDTIDIFSDQRVTMALGLHASVKIWVLTIAIEAPARTSRV